MIEIRLSSIIVGAFIALSSSALAFKESSARKSLKITVKIPNQTMIGIVAGRGMSRGGLSTPLRACSELKAEFDGQEPGNCRGNAADIGCRADTTTFDRAKL